MRKIFLPTSGGQHTDFWEGCWQGVTIASLAQEVPCNFMYPIFKKFLPLKGRILEAGCGVGKYVKFFKDHGYEIEGVDFAKATIARVQQEDPALPVRCEDITRLRCPDKTYAAYYSGGVVEHFIDGPHAVLTEAHRVLKDDGILIITVPYINLVRRFSDLLRFFGRKGKWVRKTRVSGTPFVYTTTRSTTIAPDPGQEWEFHEYMFLEKEILAALRLSGFTPVYTKKVQVGWGMKTAGALPTGSIEGAPRSTTGFHHFLKKHVFNESDTNSLSVFCMRILGIFFAHQIAIVCRKKYD